MLDEDDLKMITRKANEYDFSELLSEFFTGSLSPEELRKALTDLYIETTLIICRNRISICDEMTEGLAAVARLIDALENTKPTANPRLKVTMPES